MERVQRGEFFLIAGPCVIESEEICLRTAEKVAELAAKHGIPYIFKSSYKKANRTSLNSPTGPGLDEGLKILQAVKEKTGLPVLTDIHETSEIKAVAEVADVLQIPAFLCRQTDLIVAAGQTGRWVNIKKGQFLAPDDMTKVAAKAQSDKVMLTERGSSFGYHNLVVDFRSLLIMRRTGFKIVYDVTHSLQLPSGAGETSTGQPEFVIPMARAGVAVGIDGLFIETHPNPKEALSDAGAMLPLDRMPHLLDEINRIRQSGPNV
ncbi:MAG TPA: 3-deoxy-8-phosphooctulonate synthase [candidate division Zixibacteria bacterium]|nr:3-deoxy-8-phosphooctulonate synthase [candidate division Zixibacteria bacterium]